MSYSPLQVIQFRLGLSILVLNTLSAFYLPEIMGYLNRRWRSCQPFESAREWVLIIKREFIPLLEDIHADDDLEIEREAEKLRDATARCLTLIGTIEVHDRNNKSFFVPWEAWPGRIDLVAQAEAEIKEVMDAYLICETVVRKWINPPPTIVKDVSALEEGDGNARFSSPASRSRQQDPSWVAFFTNGLLSVSC